jgi:alcohol dehydrogenase class IV
MKEFDFRAPFWNVVFGAGALRRTPQLLDQLGFRRPLILSTPGRAGEVAALERLLAGSAVATFARAAVHVPVEIVEQALRSVRDASADCTISYGGGSATGLGKALRLREGLPQIAIPTTYAGSEMTDIWGITENNVKQTGRATGVLPVLVIYDPELLVPLPRQVAGPSALNAMAQAIANLPGLNDDPFPTLLAREAIAVLGHGLPRLLRSKADLETCSELLYGACLAGAALGSGRSGLHHRICHVLGGMFNLPHADTHAVILPYSFAFNRNAAPAAGALIADALGVTDAAKGIYDLMRLACRSPSLRELGLTDRDLDTAADAVLATPVSNPVAITRGSIGRLLKDAFEGNLPVN